MRSFSRPRSIVVALGLACGPVAAQETIPARPAQANAAANSVAATVNGQPIYESAVQRGLKRVPPDKHAEARKDILDFLVDNALIDQCMTQLKIEVPPKEVDDRFQQICNDIKKQGGVLEKVFQEMMLTEPEVKAQIAADLRWDKYATSQATEAVLRDTFSKSPEMFDGTMVRARHILLPPAADAEGQQKAKAQLLLFKQQIEQKVAEGLAKLPQGTDNLTREKARARLTEESFAEIAKKESSCPSKVQG